MKGITLKICRLCVYVVINKRSFKSFMCLDPVSTDSSNDAGTEPEYKNWRMLAIFSCMTLENEEEYLTGGQI